MATPKTVCIIMMVKNESHCVTETLASTLSFANEYIICDIGSTDNTIDVCNNFFEEHKIKGQIFELEWRNLAYNYTLTLQLGKVYTKSDYLWLIDADDLVHGTPNLYGLNYDAYLVKFNKDFGTYLGLQLFSTKLEWKHIGMPGYNTIADETMKYTQSTLEGNYHIGSRQVDDRYKNIDRKVISPNN